MGEVYILKVSSINFGFDHEKNRFVYLVGVKVHLIDDFYIQNRQFFCKYLILRILKRNKKSRISEFSYNLTFGFCYATKL